MTPHGRYLLDTNTVSYLLSGKSPAARQLYRKHETGGRILVSVITQAEILFGLESKPTATRLRAAIKGFLASVQILPWDSSTAKSYAAIRSQLSPAGKSLSVMDLLIAAHALSTGATLVTHDRAFLHAATMVKVVDWATDL